MEINISRVVVCFVRVLLILISLKFIFWNTLNRHYVSTCPSKTLFFR